MWCSHSRWRAADSGVCSELIGCPYFVTSAVTRGFDVLGVIRMAVPFSRHLVRQVMSAEDIYYNPDPLILSQTGDKKGYFFLIFTWASV